MATRPELLSPAGDFESLCAAVDYGADAVYVGGKEYGMRGAPENFDFAALCAAADRCHRSGVRLYLTLNTLPRGGEVDRLPDFLCQAGEAGVDALIVADLGTLLLARRLLPRMELHVSTQAGVVNHLTATELHRLGASRVILARELTLEEVGVMRAKTPPDLAIEAFVHGSMCVSFSGRCLLSQYLTGRDGNRGRCAQPCRWGYHLVEETRPGQYFPISEDEEGAYILNANDLCMLPHLDKLAQAGVTSFKIEGRAKSAYYVAVVTGAYRRAIDLYLADPEHYSPPDWLWEEVHKISHRPYDTGFYFGGQPAQQYDRKSYIRSWELAATVDGVENGFLLCTERNRFRVGDTLELIRPGARPRQIAVEALYDGEGNPLSVANHPMMRLRIPFDGHCPGGAMLRRQCGVPGEDTAER